MSARNAAAWRDATALLLQRRFVKKEVYVSEVCVQSVF